MEIVLNKAFTMVIMIIMGYVLKQVGFLKKENFKTLSKISLSITLPAVIIGKFSDFTMNYSFLVFVLVGMGINLATNLAGFLIGTKGGRSSRAFYMINLSGFNVGAFALPFVQNFLGADGVVATCLFDSGNSLMCTGGTFALASFVADSGERQSFTAFLKKLFSSVPLDTYIIMLILAILQIRLPSFILSLAGTIGNANSFLAMLVIGIGFEWRLKKEEVKSAGLCLIFRYTMSTILALCFYFLLPFSQDVREALTMISFAPLSALCPVFTQRVGGSESLSSTINSLTILCSTIIMTFLLLLFNA